MNNRQTTAIFCFCLLCYIGKASGNILDFPEVGHNSPPERAAENPPPIVLTYTVDQMTCVNPQGTIHLVIAGGGGPSYYTQWTTVNGSITTGANTLNPVFNAIGTYIGTVTDAATGMTASVTVVITQQPAPLYVSTNVTNIGPNGNNGLIDVSVCGGVAPYNYQWSNGSNQEDPYASQPGTYTVTVTDSYGCTGTSSATLYYQTPSSMDISATVSNAACGQTCNGTISINAIGGGTAPYTYLWNTSSTTQNLTNLCAGTYVLTVVDASGISATAYYTIQQPSQYLPLSIQSSNPGYCNNTAVGSGSNCEKVCPKSRVTYTLPIPPGTCGGNFNLVWLVQGATSYTISSSGTACEVVWGETGSGSISVSGSNNFYCTQTNPVCVAIVEEPVAKFSTIPATPASGNLQVCKGQTVWFENTSLNADLYEWTFGDDFSTSVVESPKHEFNIPGLHTVQLIARSLCLCADTITAIIEVLDSESPLLDCVSTICPGEQITYTTTSSCASFNWSVSANGIITSGGGPTDNSITVQWNSGPDGTITLAPQTCSGTTCPTPAVIQVPILSDDAEIEGRTRVCPNSEEVYKITPFGGGTYFTWKSSSAGTILEGQGTDHILVSWKYTGNVDSWISVTYENCYLGCTGSDTIWVKVRPPFAVSGPLELCEDASGSFQAKLITNGTAITSTWTVYDPNGTAVALPGVSATMMHLFDGIPGIYRVKAVPAGAGLDNTCSDSASYPVRIASKPAAPAGISGSDYFCPGEPLTYTATGISQQNNILWQVKRSALNPSTQNGNPIVVTFLAGSPRWVAASQVTADALGCASDTVMLAVHEIPAFSLTGPGAICENTVATYNAPFYKNQEYLWEIIPANAGVIAKGQGKDTIEVFWVEPGNHTVKATVCSKSASTPVTVWASPNPNPVTPIGVCPGATALADAAATYTSYAWKDVAGTVIGVNQTIMLADGFFALTVMDQHGCEGTKEFSVKAFPKPNLTITTADPTGFCNNSLTVSMFALTTQDGDFHYEWYRDGVPLGVDQDIYSTNQYGYYSASVVNQYGCTASDGDIHIFEYCQGVCHNPSHPVDCPPGSVGLAVDQSPRCDSFQFHLVTGAGFSVTSNTWHFGESGSDYLGGSSLTDPTFKFPNAGKYIVVLYATLQNGALCKILDSVFVEAAAQFAQVPNCPGDSSFLKDVSTFLPDAGISGWQWDFGEISSGSANNSSTRDVKHAYANSGFYDVLLTVTANSGCTSSYSKPVEVPLNPLANFGTPTTDCAGNATLLNVSPGPDIIRMLWDFGDPASGALNFCKGDTVYHNYNTAGLYTATVTVKNIAGCNVSADKPITIIANTLTGPITPTGSSTICEGKNLLLAAPPVGISYVWSDGSKSQGLLISQEDVYRVTITDANGCTYVPPAKIVKVDPAPDGDIRALLFDDLDQLAGFSFSPLDVCKGEDVNLAVFDNGNYTYNWTGGSSGDNLLFSDDHSNALSVGNHSYTVTLTNPGTGCTTVSSPFVVIVDPVPSGFSATSDQFCAGIPAIVSYNGPQPPNWQLLWNNGEIGPSFSTTDPGHYFVRVVNEFGCVAESNKVTIKPGPNIAAIPGGCHTRCTPDSLCIQPMPDIVSWQWFFNGTAISGATGPNLVATQSGSYWAELIDTAGCTAQSEPLDLNLYDGYGSITGKVWSDVNNNGIIDGADTLVSNIPVFLLGSGSILNGTTSNATGDFAFPNILSTDYGVILDPMQLPAGWQIVVGQKQLTLVGCDAKAQVDLLIHKKLCQATASSVNISICAGGSYMYNGTAVPAGQTQQFTLQNAEGCDSLVTVAVSALPPPAASTMNVSVCQNEAYNYNGMNIPAGQTQQFTLQTTAGCDSLVTVAVSALPTGNSLFEVDICAGSMYDYAGTMIPAGQTQQFMLQTMAGCDSIVTVAVNALPAASKTLNVNACAGTTYTYNGTNIPAGQSQQFTLQTATGCDSIVMVVVSALPAAASTHTASVCSGDVYNYNGTAIPAGQTQQFTLQTIAGCDSVVTVVVSALPTAASTHTASVCPGDVYNYNGTAIAAGQTQQFTLQNTNGCDSVVTVVVSALPTAASTHTASVCPGDVYNYNGTAIAAGQTQQFTLQTINGCDSVVTVVVSALPTAMSTHTASVCPGDFYNYNGTAILAGQTQQFTLQTTAGCDSIVTVVVSALPTASSTHTASVCPGDVYNYNGSSIPAGQTQQFTLQTTNGCDSLVTVIVSAFPTAASAFSAKICPGETYNYHGTAIPAGQTQQFTLQTTAGCDSVVTLTVIQLPTSSNTLEKRVCPNTTYNYNGTELAPGQTYEYHFLGYEGCDSTVLLTVSSFPDLDFSVNTEKSCVNTPNGSLTVQNPNGGLPPFRFSIDGSNFQQEQTFKDLAAGNYTIYVLDGNDCLFSDTSYIYPVGSLQVALPDAVLDCDSNSLNLVPLVSGDLTNLQYLWWNGAKTPETSVTEAEPVWLEVSNQCQTVHREATVEWGELGAISSYFYMPNIFAPEAENVVNTVFRPYFAQGLIPQNYLFEVYDRWGSLVFRATQEEEGWDAFVRSKLVDPGVYVWRLEADIPFCGRVIGLKKNGDVTVLR